MVYNKNSDDKKQKHHILIRLVLCFLIIAVGIGGFIALASFKKPPAEAQNGERALKVAVLKVQAQSIPVTITGYGQVRALNAVKISAEVAGQVKKVHSRLEVGEVIPAGELLFQIDSRDYAAAAAQTRAEVNQWTSVRQRLEKQTAIDTERLKTLERNRDLARAEFDRINNLFQQHSVGTRSGVDRAEQAYNSAMDQADQMAQTVTLYPIRIKEAQSSLTAAKARRKQALANLQRCQVRSPFDGRLTMTAVEQGQYVSPGQALVTLTDDSVLEIQVPLDSRDVRQWLRFTKEEAPGTGAWFGQPEPVVCRIRWTEDKQGHAWNGGLHRMVEFDRKTRTVTVAIRIDAAAARSENKGLPLVEGMFCAVEIPGRTIDSAFQVPRSAVSFKNTVFMAVDGRLKTVDVQVTRVDGDHAYIVKGLNNGDTVITTRLVDPLENTLLEIISDNDR